MACGNGEGGGQGGSSDEEIEVGNQGTLPTKEGAVAAEDLHDGLGQREYRVACDDAADRFDTRARFDQR